jgi:hypothetical protein
MNGPFLAQLRRLADGRCDYCRIPEEFDPLPFQLDHVIARQHGGETALGNLAWSCLHCNKHKGPNIAGIDPVTGQLTALFHPRRQRWERHFMWNGAILVGRTRIARATIRGTSGTVYADPSRNSACGNNGYDYDQSANPPICTARKPSFIPLIPACQICPPHAAGRKGWPA